MTIDRTALDNLRALIDAADDADREHAAALLAQAAAQEQANRLVEDVRRIKATAAQRLTTATAVRDKAYAAVAAAATPRNGAETPTIAASTGAATTGPETDALASSAAPAAPDGAKPRRQRRKKEAAEPEIEGWQGGVSYSLGDAGPVPAEEAKVEQGALASPAGGDLFPFGSSATEEGR